MRTSFSPGFGNRWAIGGYSILLVCVFCNPLIVSGQINYVPNHSFEVLTDCDLQLGDIPKAEPWQIVPEPENTPDLFNSCSTSGFYELPTGCNLIMPKDGESMVALAQDIPPEERIYVRLPEPLPLEIDIYVAFSTLSEDKCGVEETFLCYTNTQGLAFADFAFQNQRVVLESEGIISETEEWMTLRTCYRATGEEDLLILGNSRLASETELDCEVIDPLNFGYNYYDEIIVSPFDVIPDTIVLCAGENVELDATFYDLPILWSDGVSGAIRTVEEGGQLIALGSTGRCFVRDTTFIVKIPEEEETFELGICDGEILNLETPISAVWPDGDTTRVYTVDRAGTYRAQLLADCDEALRYYNFIVEDRSCDIDFYVPNAFSPNRDGVNDDLQFFFVSEFNYSGQLHIYDRWGGLVYEQTIDQDSPTAHWNGTFGNEPLGTGAYLWVFEYVSGKDGDARVISGEVVLLR